MLSIIRSANGGTSLVPIGQAIATIAAKQSEDIAMGRLQKTLASTCLLFGLTIMLLAGVYAWRSGDDFAFEDPAEAGVALVLFGLIPTGVGSWLAWNQRHQMQQSSQALALEQLFLQLLQRQGGDLTVVQFAAAAQMPLDQAKAFLDEKARLLNATFDVSETGGIIYQFPT